MYDCAVPFVEGTLLGQGRLPLVALSCALVLPLCFLNQRYLSFTSVLAVLVNIYLLVEIVGLYGIRESQGTLPRRNCWLGYGPGNVSMVSAMVQCVVVQCCVLPMYREMEGRTPAKFVNAVIVAFLALAAFFGIYAVVAYQALGAEVKSNALLSLPRGVASNLAWIGTILIVAAVYPIMMISLVSPIEALDNSWFMKPPFDEQALNRRKRAAIALST